MTLRILIRVAGSLALLAGLLSGCATPRDPYSDQPWNQPQPWEGVLPLPGMDGRY